MTLTAPVRPILLPLEALFSCRSHLTLYPVPPGKEDGRSCKKVTIRMTIRKNECRSNTPVRGTHRVVGEGRPKMAKGRGDGEVGGYPGRLMGLPIPR